MTTLRAFVPPHWSRGIQRVAMALRRFAPSWVTLASSPHDADVIVVHVVGRHDQVASEIAWTRAQGQRLALVQYVLRSTQKPHTRAWVGLWQAAAVVWSYFDLPALAQADGGFYSRENFYYAPLGAEGSVFTPRGTGRAFVALTHGSSWLTEGVRETVLAARAVGRPVFHLGPHVRHAAGMVAEDRLRDDVLAQRYSACDYVCALRRIEGFELPAVEGLLCGARPVLFDTKAYRHWYGDLATYIPESDRPTVQAALEDLFRRPVRRVTTTERETALARFHWPTIVKGFWDRCRAAV